MTPTLPPDGVDVVDDVNVVVHHPGVSVAPVLDVQPQQALPLAAGDGEGGRRGEARDDGHRDEVDEKAKLEEAAEEDDDP